MQFLTATTLLYVRVIFLTTVAYLLVKNPETIGTSGFVILLGQAMEVPIVVAKPENPLLGALSVIFGSLALSDLIPLMANNLEYFETIVPSRLAVYFILAAYGYLVKESILSNNWIFTYSFIEIWFNFLIYNNLKDEKYYRMKKFIEENGEAIQKAHDEQVRVVELDD